MRISEIKGICQGTSFSLVRKSIVKPNHHKPGNDKPRVSTTDDMVLAVNIPPKNKIRKHGS